MRNRGVLVLSVSVLALASTGSTVGRVGRVLTVDDFEDGDRRAASGLSWISVADFQGVRLRARGRGALQLSLRGGASPGFNYSAPFEVGTSWPRWTFLSRACGR